MPDIKLIQPAEFDSLQEEWNALLDRSLCESVFLRWEWIHTWWTIFRKNRRLFILASRRDGRLIGIAPFYIDQAGLIRLRTLRFCSDELSPDYMDIIAEPGEEEEVAQELVNEIRKRSGEWDLIVLDNLRAESALLAHPSLFPETASTTRVLNHCPYIKIEGTFEDYYQPRTALEGYGFKKKMKFLLKEKKAVYHIASNELTASRDLDALFVLHEKRARLKKIKSNFLSPKVRQFHHEVSRQFFKERILSLHSIYIGEMSISSIYAFNYKNKTFVFQTGFDPAYKKWSAGAVLFYCCIQRAFKDHLREFDLLKGTEGYKALWSNAVREEWRLVVYNKTLRGKLWRLWKKVESVLRAAKRGLVGKMPEAVPEAK